MLNLVSLIPTIFEKSRSKHFPQVDRKAVISYGNEMEIEYLCNISTCNKVLNQQQFNYVN